MLEEQPGGAHRRGRKRAVAAVIAALLAALVSLGVLPSGVQQLGDPLAEAVAG